MFVEYQVSETSSLCEANTGNQFKRGKWDYSFLYNCGPDTLIFVFTNTVRFALLQPSQVWHSGHSFHFENGICLSS